MLKKRPAHAAKSPEFSAQRASASAGVQDWLNALDGVAYLVAPDGTILGVGRERWADFARSAGFDGPTPDSVVGRSLFDVIVGDDVRAAYLALHRAVASLARPALTFEYRCDAPELERLMKMSMSALVAHGRLQGVLYQATLLTARDRVPLEFLRAETAMGDHDRAQTLPFVKICQFCANVTMPAWGGAWVAPQDYYRRGGSDEVRLSHGVCPDCVRTRLEPLLA